MLLFWNTVTDLYCYSNIEEELSYLKGKKQFK